MRIRPLVVSLVFIGILVGASAWGLLSGAMRPLLGLDLVGGVSVVLTAPEGTAPRVVDLALETIRERVDRLGVAEPDITRQGDLNIQVQIPEFGGRSQQRLLELIGTTAKLEFREVLETIPPGNENYEATEITRGESEELEQEEVVFREGDTGDTCYVIREGAVRVTRDHTDGRTITLAELRPGDIFGELAMFRGETRSATVEALRDTEALAILSGDLRRIIVAHPEIAVKMLAGLADRLRAANERISRQSFQTVAGRVASALLGQVTARSPDGVPGRDVVVAATQAEIAQLAGASRESASRFLAKLERAGVITTGRGRVIVHEPEALRNYIY